MVFIDTFVKEIKTNRNYDIKIRKVQRTTI